MIKRGKKDHLPFLPLLKIQSERHRIQPANVQAFPLHDKANRRTGSKKDPRPLFRTTDHRLEPWIPFSVDAAQNTMLSQA
jgi:hypothetical protein